MKRARALAATSMRSVCARFNFCAGDAEQVLLTNPFEGDGFHRNEAVGAIRAVEHEVWDGRADADLVDPSGSSLEKRGMCLQRHQSNVTDFYSSQEIKEKYYPELLGIARQLTNATHVMVASHVVRQAGVERKNPGEGAVRGGAYFVHNDFSDKLKDQFLDMLAGEKCHECILSKAPMELSRERVRQGRLVMLNIWRPLNTAPLRRAPLGVCDAASLCSKDLVAGLYRHAPKELPPSYDLPFPILLTLPTSRPQQRWYYFPGMTKGECLVFKTYDSAGPIPGNGVAVHSAFDLPDTPPDEPTRESIEARVLCFIDGNEETLCGNAVK